MFRFLLSKPIPGLLLAVTLPLVAAAQSANLSAVKIASPNPVAPGGTLTYTVTISNEGPDNASTVSFTDNLPVGTTFLSITPAAGWICSVPTVGTNGTVSCSIATLTPTSDIFTFDVQVDGGVADSTVLSNTVDVTSATTDPQPANNTSTADATVLTVTPGLSVTKTGSPDPVAAGTDLSYTIVATNNAASPLDDATITDPLPAGTTFVSLSSPAGWSCTTPAAGAAGTVTCGQSPMPEGSASFTLVVHVSSSRAAGPLSNSVAFDSTTGGRATSVNGSTAVQVVTSADMAVTATDAPDPVTPGTTLTYSITVTNNGPSDAPSPSLSNPTPAGTTFASLTPAGGWTCTTPAAGSSGTVDCSATTLPFGGNAIFTLTVNVSPAAVPASIITDTATVSSAASSDPTPGNNSFSPTTTVGAAVADMSITKSGSSDPVEPGTNLTYTIAVQNAGPSDAAANVSDTLPTGTTFVSFSAPGGWSCTTPAVGATGSVSCAGTMASGATANFSLVVATNVLLDDGTVLSNTATVTSAADLNATNNSATVTTTVQRTPPIPTLNEWMMLLLGVTLAGAATMKLRQ
jgi:uncharacterized repeat protein (TIGR01451 family)